MLSRRGLAALGPGLLWAGTAIGVSHLVQSTRAGAGYGLTLAWVVILAHVLKYPAYEAGSRYTAATGRSLLDGYRRLGTWAVWLFLALSLGTMAIIEAAITIVTAGMASALISDAISVGAWAGVLLTGTVAILALGRFRLLDGAMKTMMLVLSVSTLLAVALLLPATPADHLPIWPPLPPLEPIHIGFLVAFIGWMPAPFDTAVWHSLWSVERQREHGRATVAEARLDFHVGYAGTAIMALAFVTLGAAALHDGVTTLPDPPAAFAEVLVDAYALALGGAARPVLLTAAFATMLSTTLAVTDGFPRAIAAAFARLRTAEQESEAQHHGAYLLGVVAMSLGGFLIIQAYTHRFTALVDFATTLSFVTAPLLAWMNLRAVQGPEVPADLRPRGLLLAAHWLCVITMAAFSLGFVVWRFG